MKSATRLRRLQTNVTTTAVATWRGEDNGLDRYGAHTAIIVGSQTYMEGQVGRAFYFDGSSFLWVPYSRDLDMANNGATGFTMKLWLKHTSDGPVVSYGSQYEGMHFAFNWWASILYWNGVNGMSLQITFAPTGAWRQLVATYEASSRSYSFYCDGVLINTLSSGPTISNTNYDFYIGRGYHGGIDEFEMWNVTLTLAQVQSIYNAEKQGSTRYQYTPSIMPTVSISPTKIITLPIAVATWRGENCYF